MSDISIWSFPTRILFGVGAVRQTGVEARRAGGSKALIVTDPGVVAAGLLAPVQTALRAAEMPFEVFSKVDANPVERNVHEGMAAFIIAPRASRSSG